MAAPNNMMSITACTAQQHTLKKITRKKKKKGFEVINAEYPDKCILIMESTDNKQCYTSFKSPFFGLMNQPRHTFPSQLHLHAWHAKFLHKIVMWAGSEALPKHLACSRELGMH